MNSVVLVAEDEPVSRAFLLDALAALGVRCEGVEDGLVALQRAKSVRYDALLLDLNLPGCDGVEILDRVRADVAAASRLAPALALTADDSAHTRQRMLTAGFAAVAGKPIGVEQLANALRGLGLTIADTARAEPAAAVPCGTAPLWDDAAALAAVGGNRAILDTLRAMMVKELAAQRETIAVALARDDPGTARAELHRLQASCGFCGAARLADSARALQAALAAGAGIDACTRIFLDDADSLLRDAD